MRINEGFELRKVCDENVIVAYGRKNIDFSKVISMNDSAAYMWNAVVGKDFTYQELAEHYNTAIIPARVRAPKDKALVERTVGVISTFILAALRNQQFLSVFLKHCLSSWSYDGCGHRPGL